MARRRKAIGRCGWGAQDLFQRQRPRPESRACGVPDDGMTWDEVMIEVVIKVVRNSASQRWAGGYNLGSVQ